tara:strand:+ start:686 stop:1468 length:783 start_codon:yes stop_codon:yes gene_type:complete
MAKYKAKMICDFNNPVSMAYANIAKKTWDEIENVDVELWQCYTPDTEYNAPFSIPWGEYSSASKYKKVKHKITPTERCCLTSMFHWWKHIADTGERVIVLEHDAFVRDVDKTNMLVDQIEDHDLWCIGIAAECINLSPRLARFAMDKWLDKMQIIDAGPMAELWTLIHDWGNMVGKRRQKVKTCTWPTNHMKNLLGRNNIYNVDDGKKILNGTSGLQRAPVTQCYFPGKNTIKHNKFKGKILYKDDTFNQMEILDDLNYD